MFVRSIGLVAAAALLTGACSSAERAAKAFEERGDSYAASGQYDAAVLEYRSAIKQRPESAELYRRLGTAYVALGRSEDAYRAFTKAVDADPNNHAARVEAGRLLLAARLYDQAQLRAEQVLDADPLNADALVLRYRSIGDQAVSIGDVTNAEAAYRSAVVDAPKSAEAYVALAQFLMTAGRHTEAEDALRKGVAATPSSELANRALASFLINSGRGQDAESYLKAAAAQPNQRYRSTLALADYYYGANRYADARAVLEHAPTDAARIRLAAIDYETGATGEAHKRLDKILKKRRNAEGLTLNAQFLQEEKKLDEAEQSARSALAIEPRLPAAHFIVGSVALSRGDFDEAARSFEAVLRLNPQHLGARLQLARARLAAGQPADAVALASQSGPSRDARMTLAQALVADGQTTRARDELTRLSSDESDPQPAIALAGLDLEAGDLQSAAAHASRALAIAPSSSDALELAGQVAIARGDNATATQHLARAVQLAPDSLDAQLMLAHVYVEQHDIERARGLLNAFVKRHPDSAAPQTALGIIHEAAGRSADAKKAFEAAIALDPREPVAASRLARLYLDDPSTLPTAIDLARTAITAQPDQADAHATLGRAYFKSGRLRSAVSELERAIALDPADAASRRQLEEARQALAAEEEKAKTLAAQRP